MFWYGARSRYADRPLSRRQLRFRLSLEDGIGRARSVRCAFDLAWRTRANHQVGSTGSPLGKACRYRDDAGDEPRFRGLDDARNFLEYLQSSRRHLLERSARQAWLQGAAQCTHLVPRQRVWTDLGRSATKSAGRIRPSRNEVSKAFKYSDKTLETVVCGSSNDKMKSYPEWEATVLEASYDSVDYISLHKYFGNEEQDTLNYYAKAIELDRYIVTIGGVIDYIKAKKRSKRDVKICFDEWNVWYHDRKEDGERIASWDWPEAPPLLEELYNLEDAIFVGSLLNVFIRRSDRVKIACMAQLVNVIAPILTKAGGPAWRQSIYYPLQYASKYGRGTALTVAQSGPTYDCEVAPGRALSRPVACCTKDGKSIGRLRDQPQPRRAARPHPRSAGLQGGEDRRAPDARRRRPEGGNSVEDQTASFPRLAGNSPSTMRGRWSVRCRRAPTTSSFCPSLLHKPFRPGRPGDARAGIHYRGGSMSGIKLTASVVLRRREGDP